MKQVTAAADLQLPGGRLVKPRSPVDGLQCFVERTSLFSTRPAQAIRCSVTTRTSSQQPWRKMKGLARRQARSADVPARRASVRAGLTRGDTLTLACAVAELRVGRLLHYLPVPTVDSATCNSSQLYRGLLGPGDICAGYTDAERSPCYNDEGAPLLCVSPDGGESGGDEGGEGVWQLQGVLAHHAHCGRAHRPAVFSSVHGAREWVERVVGSRLPSPRQAPAPAR
ncbi:Uncharacterized protein GBIM_00322 [Gryllus bimaculatus]|nr:Uncharacterized protein GBIM_00322 [Gryllus bimaculatus]